MYFMIKEGIVHDHMLHFVIVSHSFSLIWKSSSVFFYFNDYAIFEKYRPSYFVECPSI